MKLSTAPLLTEMARFIRATQNGKRRLPNGRKLSPGTIENYRQSLRLLTLFEQKQGNTLLLTKGPARFTARIHKQQTRYWKSFAQQFRLFLSHTNGFSDAYTASHFKNLKTLFHYLSREKSWPLASFTRFFSHPFADTPPLVLSPQQVQFLAQDADFKKNLSIPLQRTRLLFLFGCFTALRFSDLRRLKKSQLVSLNGKPNLKVIVKKTGQFLDIPLPDSALTLLREWQDTKSAFLLPRLSTVNFNRQLKKLLAKAGWNFPCPKFQSHKGQLTELKKDCSRSWNFHEQVSSHTMRRTAITTLLRQGVPENLVRCLSGHSPASREFHKYVSLSKNWLDAEIRMAWNTVLQAA